MPHGDYASREAYDRALVDGDPVARRASSSASPGSCAGSVPRSATAFPNAILNIHPSLLPAFPGVDAQRQAFEHGVKVTGATVHFVTPELDAGPIVMQPRCRCEPHDTAETLAARILAAEHQLYPAAVARVLDGGWRIDNRRVVFD